MFTGVVEVFLSFYTASPMPRATTRTAHLCNNLRRCRLQRGMTQQELAIRTGVSRQTIMNVERGRSLPSIFLAYRLAEALCVPVIELFHP